MIHVHEPGDVVFTRDAYHNVYRAMVDIHGRLVHGGPPAIGIAADINIIEELTDEN